ncbi:DUF5131 family protein [Eudoraea adriatica]|uniref:DUF5131 family protein n=1 Tax=Eudoraea adriatica TaxID=446681 RepID=UPI0003641E8E|nr:DUF5131 family protein [Eudoraea adriatica]
MENSKIEWTDHTWNPWYGCQKVSDGCKYCYMYRNREMYGQDGNTFSRSKTKFTYPYEVPERSLIFTCSWSDWFIDKADGFRDDAWDIIRKTPQHMYQILTKRPERIKDHLPKDLENFRNVWLGVTVESQKHVDRLSYLQEIPLTTFVSFEPLLGPITWTDSMSSMDWIIIGGESGNETGKYRYRPMELSWALDLLQDAQKHDVPVFVKQMGTYLAKQLGHKDRHGGDLDYFPEELKVREFPKGFVR